MINEKRLKAVMVLNNDTQITLADALHIHRVSMNNKINGRTSFSLDEIGAIIRRYNLSSDDVVSIFFADTVK